MISHTPSGHWEGRSTDGSSQFRLHLPHTTLRTRNLYSLRAVSSKVIALHLPAAAPSLHLILSYK
jgi:hypothetical protein